MFVEARTTIEIEVSPYITIERLKDHIQDKVGCLSIDFFLTFGSKYLADSKVLCDYRVPNNGTLCLSLRLLGGSPVKRLKTDDDEEEEQHLLDKVKVSI